MSIDRQADADGDRASARRLMPGSRPDPLAGRSTAMIGAAGVAASTAPLKVTRRGALRRRVPARRAWSMPRSCIQHDRARAASPTLDTAAAEAAPGVVLVMTHATRRG